MLLRARSITASHYLTRNPVEIKLITRCMKHPNGPKARVEEICDKMPG